jgi:hypothetical protein
MEKSKNHAAQGCANVARAGGRRSDHSFAFCRAGCPNAEGAGMRKSGRVEKGHEGLFQQPVGVRSIRKIGYDRA